MLALTCALAAACAGPAGGSSRPAGSTTPSAQDDPAEALERFLEALDAGRWAQASGLLSARWRTSYTAARLEADYAGAGPTARETAAAARTALRNGTPLQVADGRATLPVPGGRAVVVAEAGGWRVDALE